MKKYLKHKIRKAKKMLGFTLAESMVTLGIVSFALVSGAGILTIALKTSATARAKTAAIGIANEFMELYRNLSYDQIGTTTGWPAGSIPSSRNISRSGLTFTATTRVDYIDDPFDGNAAGTIIGKPRDTAPNDYKRMEIKILSSDKTLTTLTTIISPRGLESAPNTGSLLLKVFDATGQPVPEATIQITNSTTAPQVNITNTTDIDGNLSVLSLPPSLQNYRITVAKSGYTTDGTEQANGNGYTPAKPDLSIMANEVTEASFTIDRKSTLIVKTVNQQCQSISNKAFRLAGRKLRGNNPDTLKYSGDHDTGQSGRVTIGDLEWDQYDLNLAGGGNDDIAGKNPSVIDLPAGVSQELTLVLAPHSPHSLLVTVNDANTGLPLTDAAVTVSRTGDDPATLITGRGFFIQSDWSGGGNQAAFTDPDQYWSKDQNIDDATTAGILTLSESVENFAYEESFSSIDRQDIGATTAVWDGSGIVSLPQTGGVYELQAAAQTIKINSESGWIGGATVEAVQNLNSGIIRYLLSSDGGLNFEPVNLGEPHAFALRGSDLRLRMELETPDNLLTPTVDTASVSYSIESYQSPGALVSSTFDTGGSSTFQGIQWDPANQIAEAGADSAKFQIAANNDNSAWNFKGPDNTADTYYSTSGMTLGNLFDNNRYVRYRAILSTEDTRYSPTLSSVAIGYTSGCTPPGQVFFGNLRNDSYLVEITKTGYTAYSTTIDVQSQTEQTIPLTPEP